MAGRFDSWSKTAASNSNSDATINWAEGQLPSTVNGSARAEMAALASFRDDINGTLTTAGSSNAYTLTSNIAFTAYATGLMVAFKANHVNTGAATLNVNSIGAKALRTQDDTALNAGQIANNGQYFAKYDAAANGAAGAWLLVGVGRRQTMAIVRDEKSSGTAGGGFTSGADRVRDLNAETDPDGIVSISSNRFTLQAGTWMIAWSAPALQVDSHQTILHNFTDATDVKRGTSEWAASTDSMQSRSCGHAIVTITAAKEFEIRHRCQTTKATTGFGVAGSFGTEVYTEVLIQSYNQ